MKRSLRERLRMRKRGYVPNTFIGGIAKLGGTGVNAPILTAAELAARLGIYVSIIKGFRVVGEDVECRIMQEYTAKDYAFGQQSTTGANQNITYFHDLENKCTGSGFRFFGNCQEFLSAILNGYVIASISTNGNAFDGCVKMTHCEMNNLEEIQGYYFFKGTKISVLNLPSLSKITSPTTSHNFQNMTELTILSAKKLKQIGVSPNVNYSNFLGIKLNATIEVHIDLATANNGDIDADLLYAYTSRNATINFYDDDGEFVETYNPNPDLYTQNDACSIGANETESIGAGWSVSHENEIGLSIASGNNSNWSLKVTKIGTDQTGAGRYAILTISGFEPNETYRFSADSRATNATEDGAGQGWFETNKTNGEWSDDMYFDIDTFEWTNNSFECTPLLETARFRLYPSFTSEGSMQNWSCFLDNIVIEKISNPDPEPEPEVLAFPGAVGFGKYATGGRGGAVIKVTNLNNSGTGSLRQALQHTSGPRIIVFEVGGVINLTSTLGVTNGNVTIAGQTATGDGILIKGHTLSIESSNVIIRHVRFRSGVTPGDDRDALSITAWESNVVENIIIDHCSMSWAEDENLNMRSPTDGTVRNITVQNSIVSESGYGVLITNGSHKITLYKNLFAFNQERNIRYGYPIEGDYFNFEMINNLIYGCGSGTTVSYGSRFTVLNNHYKETSEQTMYAHIVDATNAGEGNPSLTYAYISGNIVPTGHDEFNQHKLNTYIQPIPYESSLLVPILAIEVEDDIKSHVGASLPLRDSVDSGIITKLNNGTGEVALDGVVPTMNGGTPLVDSNNDGIPDDWTLMNMPTGATYNDIAPSGYTWIEEYLNQID